MTEKEEVFVDRMLLGERPNDEDYISEEESDISSDEDEVKSSPERVNVSPFAQALLHKKKELGRKYAHNAFYYNNSSARKFLDLKKRDPDAKCYLAGSWVWVPDKTKIYEPARVLEDISFSEVDLKEKKKLEKMMSRANISATSFVKPTADAKNSAENETVGKILVVESGKKVVKNVSAKAARHFTAMQEDHLACSPYFDLNVDDLSPASLMYSVRSQFEDMNSECLQVGEKSLIYVNRFLDAGDELAKGFRNENMFKRGEIERPVDVSYFTEKVFQKLNKSKGTQPQSMVVMGNSDSNRRFIATGVARKLTQLTEARDASWYAKLMAADEILTVFGGESFIRWTELHMNYVDSEDEEEKGKLIGAAFQSFLLSTSNIISKKSTSFDIFHQLCSAAHFESENHQSTGEGINYATDLKKTFGFKKKDRYFYLNHGKTPEHRFTKAEIKEYFEDPEEKRRREEARLREIAEKKAAEERARIEKDKRIKQEKLKAEENARVAREKAAEAERRRKERAKQRPERKVGKVDLSRFTNKMKETNEGRKNKRVCERDGCNNEPKGTDTVCMKCLMTNLGNEKAFTVVAKPELKEKKKNEPSKIRSSAVAEEQPMRESKSEEANVEVEAEVEPEEEEEEEEEEAEPEMTEEEKGFEKWEKTLDNLKLMNIKDEEIHAMIKLMRDILEIGNVVISDSERKDGKKKKVEIMDRASDDEKDREIVKKQFNIEDLTKRQFNAPTSKMFKETKEQIDVNEEGQLLKHPMVEFLVEKGRAPREVFGVKLLELQVILNHQKLKFGAEEVLRKVPRNKCLARRDALVRALYSSMFNWLLSAMNRGVSYTKAAKSKNKSNVGQVGIIAILETIGLIPELTTMESNGLEQLTNNYAQEKLHSFFTIHILEQQSKIYQEENFQIQFPVGNEEVLPLILGQVNKEQAGATQKKKRRANARMSFARTFASKDAKDRSLLNAQPSMTGNFAKAHVKRLGILDICEEQLISPKGDDASLLKRITTEHRAHENLLLSSHHNQFKVKHFGAKVNYNVRGFVVGIWSSVLDDEVKTFIVNQTEDKLVKKLLTQYSLASQQKKLDEIYKTGMEQINLDIISKQVDARSKRSTNIEEKGPLIFSRHSVSSKNMRALRESFQAHGQTLDSLQPSPDANKRKALDKAKQRGSVSRGLIGMTYTLNLAGIKRERNAGLDPNIHLNQSRNAGAQVKQPTMQSMPIQDATTPETPTRPPQQQRRVGGNNRNKQTKTKDGVRLVHNTMNTLIVMLDLTEPHFVHCVPSNASLKKNEFSPMYVFEQLKLTGVIPFYGSRYSGWSFGTGYDFDNFKRSYNSLNMLLKPDALTSPSLYMKSLQEVGALSKEKWKVGAKNSRIYLKLGALQEVQTLAETAFEDLVIFIQKYWRMSVMRKYYFVLLEEKFQMKLATAMEENDLRTLQTYVGKCRWYKLATREMYTAEGKIKKLKEELRLKKKLVKVMNSDDKGKLGRLYAVLNEAKDKQLPKCQELSDAYNKYLQLNAQAEMISKEEYATRKKIFQGVVEELKEDQEFEENFDVNELIADLRKGMKDKDHKSNKSGTLNRQPKMEQFIARTSVRMPHQSTMNVRSTARLNAIGKTELRNARKSRNILADDDSEIDFDEDSVGELSDEYDVAHKNPFAYTKSRSVHSMASSVQSSQQSVDPGDQDEVNRQTKTAEMYNTIMNRKKSKKNQTARGSFLNFFRGGSFRRNSEGNVGLQNEGAVQSKTRLGSFMAVMTSFRAANRDNAVGGGKKKKFKFFSVFPSFRSKKPLKNDLHVENESIRKDDELSVDLSEDSFIRLETGDVASEPPRTSIDRKNKNMFGTIRSLFRQ